MNQHKFTGDLESFADYFMKDRRKNNVTPLFKCAVKVDLKHLLCILFTVYSSPYFPHLLDAWTKRHHPNLLFIFYEDLKRVTFTWLCNSFVGCLYLTIFSRPGFERWNPKDWPFPGQISQRIPAQQNGRTFAHRQICHQQVRQLWAL